MFRSVPLRPHLSGLPGPVARDDLRDTSQPKIEWPPVAGTNRQNGGAVLSCRGCVQPQPFPLVAAPSLPPPPRVGAPPVLQEVVMEPQAGSPASPPSPGTSSSSSSPGSAKVATLSEEIQAPDEPLEEATDCPVSSMLSEDTPAPDEPLEEATEQEQGRKSTSSSSSSASSAESLRHVDVVELGYPLVAAPEDEQAVAPPEPNAEGKRDGWATMEDEQAAPPVQSAGGKPDDCATLEDEQAAAPVDSADAKPPEDGALPEDEQAAAPAVHSAETKPDDWATWPEPPPPVVDYSFSSDGSTGAGRGAALTGVKEAPQVQTMPKVEDAAAGTSGFDPQRIPASVFQPRTSLSQAEWSMTSNESLFSIQGASDVGGPYASSRSHFDFFYDEAMAAAGAAEADAKLPAVAEGTEPGEFAVESKEVAVPGSASSHASAGSANTKKADVFRRHESGSGGSSSNFSFAFPM
ncbi:hypothetical protein BAE44_0025931 [Dichanthelium oligosanthes]|uniref:Uncharacterized protein n=1 Tax=Dichanthelium oligosanthes TaxID=888268 RepID=A0A1E5UJJ3_9POAL|nr:hypothetical protein BAE44_0025931 [Dichanthelium oligosanthes]